MLHFPLEDRCIVHISTLFRLNRSEYQDQARVAGTRTVLVHTASTGE